MERTRYKLQVMLCYKCCKVQQLTYELKRYQLDIVELKEFYQELDKVVNAVPKKDILVVLDDWNAKLGPDAYSWWANLTSAESTTWISDF